MPRFALTTVVFLLSIVALLSSAYRGHEQHYGEEPDYLRVLTNHDLRVLLTERGISLPDTAPRRHLITQVLASEQADMAASGDGDAAAVKPGGIAAGHHKLVVQFCSG